MKTGEGDQWWAEKLADLVERRNPDGTYSPREVAPRPIHDAPKRPDMVDREPGMTRQQQRLLFRKMCKANNLPWRKAE